MTFYQLLFVLAIFLSLFASVRYGFLAVFKMNKVLATLKYTDRIDLSTRKKRNRFISNCSNTEQCLGIKLAIKYRYLSYLYILISIISFIILSIVSP